MGKVVRERQVVKGSYGKVVRGMLLRKDSQLGKGSQEMVVWESQLVKGCQRMVVRE